ncbi:MAG: hypothetical protein HEEMFOPI_00509 [Holosporales bacterium]
MKKKTLLALLLLPIFLKAAEQPRQIVNYAHQFRHCLSVRGALSNPHDFCGVVVVPSLYSEILPACPQTSSSDERSAALMR